MTLDPGLRGKVACGAGAAWHGQPCPGAGSESLQVGVDELGRECRGRPLLLLPQSSRVGTRPTGEAAECKVKCTKCMLQFTFLAYFASIRTNVAPPAAHAVARSGFRRNALVVGHDRALRRAARLSRFAAGTESPPVCERSRCPRTR